MCRLCACNFSVNSAELHWKWSSYRAWRSANIDYDKAKNKKKRMKKRIRLFFIIWLFLKTISASLCNRAREWQTIVNNCDNENTDVVCVWSWREMMEDHPKGSPHFDFGASYGHCDDIPFIESRCAFTRCDPEEFDSTDPLLDENVTKVCHGWNEKEIFEFASFIEKCVRTPPICPSLDLSGGTAPPQILKWSLHTRG